MAFITEADVEMMLLEQLAGLGYSRATDAVIGPDGSASELEAYSDVILLGRLTAAIDRLNPAIRRRGVGEVIVLDHIAYIIYHISYLGRCDMKRTTIFADDHLLDEVKHLAKSQKTSVATVVREALTSYLAAHKPEQTTDLAFIAIGESGESDIAERHEELLWQK